ncbi:hypothetical protein KIH27_01590 [Mycobacterium sp. M1]|uniref:Tox-REase-7 domain-containing protein n=1 Tax=Mycolicibacter acidiphilus TaxID=2835306 RepID=A0ABS5RDB8_9MYCO|nr:hypothetical protein [Mycolicibacter acidiphilus]MBS9532278.1 hypothetical protein [Mycolicibacter acidiphilus]
MSAGHPNPRNERRQGQPGGPGGSPPPNTPSHGGKGYSTDRHERRLEWELDDAMRRRMKSAEGSLEEVMVRLRALQEHRSARGITGRLDERFGKPFDTDEWLVVDRLLNEGHNVTSIAALRSGDTTPDLAIDARLADIKTSIGTSATAFAGRVSVTWDEQNVPYVFVNATRSGICQADMEREMQAVLARGDSMYIRIIGDGYDSEYGKW